MATFDPANTIGFIGLGVMGYPMAVNLRRKIGQHKKIVVCDVNREAVQKYQNAMTIDQETYGPVEVASDAADIITTADTLITVLPSEGALRAVYLDPRTGVLAGIKRSSDQKGRRKTLIECGTVSAASISEVAEACHSLPDVDFIDAPISGGPMGSEAGTLTFMVGTKPDLFERLKANLFVHMGDPKNIILCGDVGAGTAFKIINNYVSLISVLSVSEAYNIAQRMNLDLKVLTDVLDSGSAQCWVVSKNNPVPGIHPHAPASHDYQGGFRVELAEKVLSLGRDLAEMSGASTVLDKAALGLYGEVVRDPRYAGKDARVVYKYLAEKE